MRLRFLILSIFIFGGQNASAVKWKCIPHEVLKAITQYREELRTQKWWKRPFIKDALPLAEAEEAFRFKVFRDRSWKTQPWHQRWSESIRQTHFRYFSKLITGQEKDLVVFESMKRKLSRHAQAFEKKVLPEGKAFTRPVKFVGMGVAGYFIYPYTPFGLADEGLSVLEKQKVKAGLDRALAEDPRLEEARKSQSVESKGLSPNEQKEMLELKSIDYLATYHTYAAIMSKVREISMNVPGAVGLREEAALEAANQIILTDTVYAKRMRPLFADVYQMSQPEFYSEGFFPHAPVKISKVKLMELMNITHSKLALESQLQAYLLREEGVDARLQKDLDQIEFYRNLKTGIESGAISTKDAARAAFQRSDWMAKFAMFKTMNVVPRSANEKGELTSDTLTLKAIEFEILEQLEANKRDKNNSDR